MQPLPGPERVLAVVGDQHDAASIATLLVRAARAAHVMTDGGGFDADGAMVEPEIADVLVRSVATSLLNPEIALSEAAPPFTAHPGGFADWSDADAAVLQRYRDEGPRAQTRQP